MTVMIFSFGNQNQSFVSSFNNFLLRFIQVYKGVATSGFILPEVLADHDVILTTYTTLRSDFYHIGQGKLMLFFSFCGIWNYSLIVPFQPTQNNNYYYLSSMMLFLMWE